MRTIRLQLLKVECCLAPRNWVDDEGLGDVNADIDDLVGVSRTIGLERPSSLGLR